MSDKILKPVINSALREFSINGYDGASTNKISKNAGISKGLMFHYVKNKEQLYLYLIDHSTSIIKKEYFDKLDYNEKDIFVRLENSYCMQIEILKKYPWIFDFILFKSTVKSDEINKKLETVYLDGEVLCLKKLFENIDESKFRKGLNVNSCKEVILWSNIGFTNQILEDLKSTNSDQLNYTDVLVKLEDFLIDQRRVFYDN